MFKTLLYYLENAAERFVAWAGPAAELPPVKPQNAAYRVYTTEFDETIDGAALLARSDRVIETETAWFNPYPYAAGHPTLVVEATATLRTNCDALRGHLEQALTREERGDTVVTLLFDHSGSLRGASGYLIVAEVAEGLANALTGAGIATEILGFTTVRWKGGRSRDKWLKDGRPPLPGRLNDLLHIVYLDASGGPRPGPHHFPAMRREHLYKENIDGEAMDWAHGRLLANARRRKVLIIVSDGAPVDDATLTHSWSTILFDHVKEVCASITSSSSVVLGGIGIEHRVHEFYPTSVVAKPVERLAEVAPSFVGQLIISAHDKHQRQAPAPEA